MLRVPNRCDVTMYIVASARESPKPQMLQL